MGVQQLGVIVDALVGRGLLRREPDPADRRAVIVSLTPEGNAVVERIVAMRADVAQSLLGGLSAAERDRLAATN